MAGQAVGGDTLHGIEVPILGGSLVLGAGSLRPLGSLVLCMGRGVRGAEVPSGPWILGLGEGPRGTAGGPRGLLLRSAPANC